MGLADTKATIAAYDQYSDVYDQEVIEFWDKFPRLTIEAFVSNLPGKKVLNLGSGSGRDALILQNEGLEVVCLDASHKMVEITRQFGFESHQAKFTEMSFPAQGFDGVWAYTSLIHVPPDEAAEAIWQLRTFLMPGGIFLIGVILGERAEMVVRRSMPGAERYFKHYQRDEITKMVSSLGFKLQYEERYQPHRTIYLSQVYKLD
jgi:SAM-dependent methyltransferase